MTINVEGSKAKLTPTVIGVGPEQAEVNEANKDYTLIGNLRIYGQPLGKVASEEVSNLVSNPTTELHLLRHFREVPAGYQLVGKEKEVFNPKDKTTTKEPITEQDTQKAIDTKGSKLFIGVPGLETPANLVNLVRQEVISQAAQGKLNWYDGGFCKKTYLQIEFPSNIGTDSVVPLASLQPAEISKVTQQVRGKLAGDDFSVNVIGGHKGVPSNKLSVVIGHIKGESAPVIFAAYPGSMAADFPRDHQSEAEKAYNKEFWANHGFIG